MTGTETNTAWCDEEEKGTEAFLLHGDCLSALRVGRYLGFCESFGAVLCNTSENIMGKLYQKGQETLNGQRRREKVRNSRADTKVRVGEGRGQGRRCSGSGTRYPPRC